MSETQTRQEKIAARLASILKRAIKHSEIEMLIDKVFTGEIKISKEEYISFQSLFNYYPTSTTRPF